MIFKLNDYNAFLTSLFDKNNEQLQRHQSHQLQNYNQSQNSNTIMTFANNNNNNNRNNSNMNSEIADDENNTNNGNTYHQNGGFPVDFDFGLAPPPFIADLPHNNTNNGNGNLIIQNITVYPRVKQQLHLMGIIILIMNCLVILNLSLKLVLMLKIPN